MEKVKKLQEELSKLYQKLLNAKSYNDAKITVQAINEIETNFYFLLKINEGGLM